jgi:hypothetical protein
MKRDETTSMLKRKAISERLRTGKPLSSLPGTKKPVNVHKIRLNLTNNLYLLISHVVPCFVQALLPKISHQEMHDFKAVLRQRQKATQLTPP